MASVVARTFFIKNIVKTKHCCNLTAYRFTSIISSLGTEKTYNNEISFLKNIPYNKYSSDSKNAEKKSIGKGADENKEEKLSLLKKFKIMYRDYWYVLVPVHVVTSTVWFGGFYFMAKR